MGREFLNIFDKWAHSYDATVYGQDQQYREVFENYDDILQSVANLATGTTIEFGVGTGNLFKKLIENDLYTIGIEPNDNMRSIALNKFPNHTIKDGDFLNFYVNENVHTIVSSYAFHHLTDQEKREAVQKYKNILSENGQIIFADTMFETVDSYLQQLNKARQLGYFNLAEDLEREYYTILPIMRDIFESNGYDVTFKQLNTFVWLIHAKNI